MTSGHRLSLLRTALALAGLALAGLLATAAPARADLRVCNDSSNAVSIALGYRSANGWQSEGWWVAPPSKCAIIFQGDLNSRFYYLYVADDVATGNRLDGHERGGDDGSGGQRRDEQRESSDSGDRVSALSRVSRHVRSSRETPREGGRRSAAL